MAHSLLPRLPTRAYGRPARLVTKLPSRTWAHNTMAGRFLQTARQSRTALKAVCEACCTPLNAMHCRSPLYAKNAPPRTH